MYKDKKYVALVFLIYLVLKNILFWISVILKLQSHIVVYQKKIVILIVKTLGFVDPVGALKGSGIFRQKTYADMPSQQRSQFFLSFSLVFVQPRSVIAHPRPHSSSSLLS